LSGLAHWIATTLSPSGIYACSMNVESAGADNDTTAWVQAVDFVAFRTFD
jgi:hypothetical protein